MLPAQGKTAESEKEQVPLIEGVGRHCLDLPSLPKLASIHAHRDGAIAERIALSDEQPSCMSELRRIDRWLCVLRPSFGRSAAR